MASKLVESTLPSFDNLWDYDNPAETEKKFRDLLTIATASGKTSYYAQLLTQIARTEGLQRKFEEAHRTLDDAERLLPNSDTGTRVRYLLERGRVFNSSGKPSEARPLFLQAFDLAKKAGEGYYAVDAAHMMAIIEPSESQVDWNLNALDLAEKSSDPRAKKWRGSLYNNMGWTFFDSKRYENALDMFRKALRCREEQGQTKEIRIAKWSVAKTLRVLGRLDDALEAQKGLLAEYEGEGEKSGYVYEELGECLLGLGQRREAGKFFVLAYEQLSKDAWLVENEPKRLERLRAQGEAGRS